MNLSDNLKKIRKDNNLSQEDLAEKLGVSRQSVSKWESGLAYPEMDKVLQICKMFNIKLDDLLNNDIKKVEKESKLKININKYIDDFLAYITKAVDMFINMKLKDRIKCVLEQIIIIIVLSLLLKMFGGVMANLSREILFFLSDRAYNVFYHIGEALYSVFCIIIIIVIVLHIFKVRYLDYYKIVDKEESENNEEKDERTTNETKKKTNEKIIIRDPNHSGDKFISGLLKILLIMLKIFLLSFAAFLCFTFIGFVICFVVSFMFIKTGIFFIGIILMILACLLFNYIILDLLYHFYINIKPKFTMLGIMLIISLIVFGVGCGLLIYDIPNFDIIDTDNKTYYTESEKTYELTDDMVINDYYYNLKYVETDNSEVVIKCVHPKIYNVSFEKHNDKYINIERNVDNEMNIVRHAIKDVNNKKIINYDNMTVTVYTSKENILKLKENKEKEYMNEYEKHIDELEREIDAKEDEISNLQDKIYELEN